MNPGSICLMIFMKNLATNDPIHFMSLVGLNIALGLESGSVWISLLLEKKSQ